VEGAWTVGFTPGWDAPESTTFESLIDWTESKDLSIKYYSGKAVYTKEVDLPEDMISGDLNYILDLGEVGNIAHVKVNGTDFGRFWHPPMEVRLDGVLKPGKNVLEIGVTGTWNNRLVGDARYPGMKKTWLATDLLHTGNEPLIPSGLMGPVRILAAKNVTVQ
jgi:hypothetical protein